MTDDIESHAAGRPDRRSDDRSANGSTQSPASDTESDVTQFVSGDPTTVEVTGVRATLLGVPSIPLREFVYDHRRQQLERPDERRHIALFDIENTSDRPVRWQPSRTTFVGDDDYTYQQARLSLDPSALGPGCHTRRVDIDPGRRARVVTLVERLPPGVDVAEVVHRVSTGHDTDRLTFIVG